MVLASALIGGQADSTGQVFEQAASALRQGDYAAAEKGFREVLRREPGNVGALGNLGVTYSRWDRPAQAIAVYEQALKLAPDQPGLLLNLGLAYLKLDAFAQAKPLFAKLKGPQAEELLAITRLQCGEADLAIPVLERLGRAPNPNPAVLHFLAAAYIKQGKRDAALPTLARLFELLPPARAHFLEGQAWYDGGMFDASLEHLEKARALEPTMPGLELALGKVHISKRNPQAAEAYLRAALAHHPLDTEALYFLGALMVQEGRPQEGVSLLERVNEARPDLWGTSYYLGKAKLALKQPAQAVALLERAVKNSPKEAPVHYQLARALQAAGRAAEAKVVFARVSAMQSSAHAEPLVVK